MNGMLLQMRWRGDVWPGCGLYVGKNLIGAKTQADRCIPFPQAAMGLCCVVMHCDVIYVKRC
jgi:hypothetical protein